jgi:hypothetical protein
MQQDVPSVRVDVLLARLVALVRFPGGEDPDEFRQCVALGGPGRMILRQQQSGCVGCQLPECHLADVAALLELGHVLVDGIIETELALSNGECQQRCVENLAKRSEIELRIRSDRTCDRPCLR